MPRCPCRGTRSCATATRRRTTPPRGWDLGYAAYRFVSLTPPGHPDGRAADDAEQRRRLALCCAAYGGIDADDVVRWALRRVERLAASDSPHASLYAADAHWLRTF